jgi:GNAT superfamily N-acetyltransferase
MLHVRPADPYDAAPIAEILDDARVMQVVAEPDALTRQRVRAQIAGAEDGAHDVFVAEREDLGVIGFAAVNWTQNLRLGVDALVSDLFVRSDARGEGAGSALIDRVKDEAASRGCARLVLYSGRGGRAYERDFYPKQGFAEHDELACFMLPVPPDGD